MSTKSLSSLETLSRRFGAAVAEQKLALLMELARADLESARQVLRLHEILCFMRAYPDNRRVLSQVRRMLESFHRRADLDRHVEALADSGIVGTTIRYRFYQPTADWIARTWPGVLQLDVGDREVAPQLFDALLRLLPTGQADWLRSERPDPYAALERLRPRGITNADFLLGLIRQMPGDEFAREAFGDELDLTYLLAPGRHTPERTTAHFPAAPTVFQETPLQSARTDLRRAARRPPKELRRLGRDAANRLVELARIAMVTRARDLAAFQFADPTDLFLVDDGGGLMFAMMGVRPPRRALIAATYGALTLRNGVPIGYLQADLIGRHAELSFNTFESFRGAETGHVFARFISAVNHVFGCDSFSIEPYQLGENNEEGLESGAWWFYYKHGFRPRAEAARKLASREARRLMAKAGYRSGAPTLRALSKSHLYFHLDATSRARLPKLRPWLDAAARALKRYKSADPRKRNAAAITDAVKKLGLSRLARFNPSEKAALTRWAPLVLAIDGLGRWSRDERVLLLRLIRAKGGRSEREFNRILLKHQKLRTMLDC